ncbi:MAG: hypothetical protein KKH33_07030 [Alphaproteobacteria bacterium]|nr:hypothetical protein [Alphaproteobacteria bacterium]
MKRLTGYFAAAALLGAPAAAQASAQGPGMISTIHVMDDGVVMFTLTGNRTARPVCASSPARWSFNGTSPAGQVKLATLLTAYSSGKQIMLYGSGSCPDWPDTESVNWFHIVE